MDVDANKSRVDGPGLVHGIVLSDDDDDDKTTMMIGMMVMMTRMRMRMVTIPTYHCHHTIIMLRPHGRRHYVTVIITISTVVIDQK